MTRVSENPSVMDGALGRFSIRELLPRHFRVIDMLVADHTVQIIADTLGMTRRAVGMIKKSPLVQEEIARRRKEDRTGEVLGMDREAIMGKARSILEQATEPAALKIEQLMHHSKDETLQFNSAKYILEQMFGKPGQGTQIGTVINVSAEYVQLLNQAIRESNNEHTSKQQPNPAPTSSSEGGQVNVCEVQRNGE
jgi:hypothetical protein